VLCEMATPPLSSVQFSAVRTGYEAASMLDQMMAGEAPPSQPLLIAPIGITTRGSSDVVAIEDPLVAKALRFIRERARDGIKVDDVSVAVGMSRSTLERRMRRILGRSPQEEITRVKLNLVRELLVETDLSLDKVAVRAGFAHVQYMVELFRTHFETTPGQYRKKVRLPEN
jgi:LacI family transcriptional regulator